MSNRKEIDVRDQVTLSFEKSFRFCRKGISYRLFRSSLTLAVVVVAVAFFTVLLSESLMTRSTSMGVADEMLSTREADALMTHLFHRYSSRELSVKLSAMRNQPVEIAEFARVAGMSEDAANDLVRQSHVEQLFLEFFRNLSAGKRVVLIKKHTGSAVFDYLAEKENWDGFMIDLSKMRSVRLPSEAETLRTFLDNRANYLKVLDEARLGRNKTVATMQAALNNLTGGADSALWLADASDTQVSEWQRIVSDGGIALEQDVMTRVRTILKVSALESRIAKLLQTPEKREEWKVKLQSTPGLEEKFLMLEDEAVGEILGDAFSAEQRAAVANRFTRMKHLRALAGKLPMQNQLSAADPAFLDGRQTFLIVISFLVCMVGITNAMLMSITERFREIATMKCLGATDGFILKQFLIEAAIQGVVGGVAGMVIGMVISILKSSIILGSAVFAHFPTGQMLICAVITVIAGIVLAMLASIYPAKAAASMAPMDAMRVE